MIEKALEEIVEADLQALVSRGVTEGRHLDYKLQLPGRPADVRDFLIDVASFANGDGGDMIFGMAEDGNSVAKALTGLATDNLDEQLQGLESRVRDCIDVRLPSFRIHRVGLASGRAALVVRVRASLLAPHRVRYDKHSYFFGRNSGGKFEMDATELRVAFAATEALPAQLQALHDQSVARLESEDMPCMMHTVPMLVLTVAPVSVVHAHLLPRTEAMALRLDPSPSRDPGADSQR